jgi:hypothetical protein
VVERLRMAAEARMFGGSTTGWLGTTKRRMWCCSTGGGDRLRKRLSGGRGVSIQQGGGKVGCRLARLAADAEGSPSDHDENDWKALNRLRRLTGQMGLSPSNCREARTACVRLLAMYGAKYWWKGEGMGTEGRVNDLQKLVNHEARVVTGCVRTTNLGVLSMESGLRPAAA